MNKFFTGVLFVIGLAIFCLMVLMVIGSFYNPKPTPKDHARKAIEICIENTEKEIKYGRSDYAFFLRACDNMAEEFERKYGHKP